MVLVWSCAGPAVVVAQRVSPPWGRIVLPLKEAVVGTPLQEGVVLHWNYGAPGGRPGCRGRYLQWSWVVLVWSYTGPAVVLKWPHAKVVPP